MTPEALEGWPVCAEHEGSAVVTESECFACDVREAEARAQQAEAERDAMSEASASARVSLGNMTEAWLNEKARAEQAEGLRDAGKRHLEKLREFWRAERDFWKAECRAAKESRDAACHERDATIQALAQAEAERDRLRAALKRYGAHWPDCPYPSTRSMGVCTCGLDATLKGSDHV
jgi:hypothetical protein